MHSHKLTIIPVICSTKHYELDIFCDFMRRTEYLVPDIQSRRNFAQENVKILVSYSPSFQCFLPENNNVPPEECFTRSRYCELVKNKSFDTLPLGIVSEDTYCTSNALYLAMLPSFGYTLPPNSRWMTPNEIMEKVKNGGWHHSQEKTITFLLDSLLSLPEINNLHNIMKRRTW